jgi:hypothetical protein
MTDLPPILKFGFPVGKRSKKADADAKRKRSPFKKRSILGMICYTSLKDIGCLPIAQCEPASERGMEEFQATGSST